MAQFEQKLSAGLTEELYHKGKDLGYPDKALLRLSGAEQLPCAHQLASYKMVDTCGAEFDAQTPYFYSVSSSAPESPWSWFWAPALSVSDRVSSLTTPLSTVCGP